jgi:hypothetical protein
MQQVFAYKAGKYLETTNYESGQPPLYYFLTGGWWRVCQAAGWKGANRVFALRCLNGFLLAATILAGWLAARLIFPENRFIRVAAPAIIACQPQSIYYCVSDDNLVALTFGLVFLLVLKCWQRDALSVRQGMALGLAFAAVFLTKLTCVPLLAVAACVLVIKAGIWVREAKWRASRWGLAALSVSAGIPALAWMLWCRTRLGDWSGSAQKSQLLHWTLKPVADWFDHPLFSVGGFLFFIGRNIATFWQGEALWFRQPLANPWADLAYVLGTVGSVLLVFMVLVVRPQRVAPLQRVALWFGMAGAASLLLFLAWMSVRYDYHDCFNPSSAVPFFLAGRMMLGVLIPAILIFAKSLDLVLFQANERLKFLVLGLLLLVMLAVELYVDHPVFHSQYSWIRL